MNNFGVREVANSKSAAAPGWAYVPDTGVNASVAASQPSSRKRARNTQTVSAGESTAKQDAKILRGLVALDRENHRDVTIPVPIRHRDNAGRVSHGKVTPAVRKILQSQKTWANYLADFEAAGAQSSYAPTTSQPIAEPTTPAVRSAPKTPAESHLTTTGKRSHKKKDPNAPSASTPLRRVSSASQVSTPAPVNPEPAPDVVMKDAPPLLSFGTATVPAPHAGDRNPLLLSRIPAMPPDAEIRKLLAEPPLTYNEAKGPWVDEDMRKPIRRFCERCGYWGRVRCTKCGTRVCALECYNEHVQECLRYGP